MAIPIKTQEQIEGIRKSCQLSIETLKYLQQFVIPGVSTAFINKKCDEFLRSHQALPATLNYHNFPASCCTSVNDVVCHGVPNDSTILREGDILNIDVTAILDGYFGDTCTMFKVGEVTPYAQNLLNISQTCLELGVKECYPGNQLGNIGYAINKYATENGCSVVFEFCGHGVGLAFHEEPEVSHIAPKNSGPILKPGMVFTIEPMINAGKARTKVDRKDGWTARTIDGKLSAQYEHTVCITETGVDVLTQGLIFP